MNIEDQNLPRPAKRPLITTSTVITLLVASFLVGMVMNFAGLDPAEFWGGIFGGMRDFVEGVLGMGWSAVTAFFTYILFGAMIVVPIWLVARLLSRR